MIEAEAWVSVPAGAVTPRMQAMAEVAGLFAARKAPELIPLHAGGAPCPVAIEFSPREGAMRILARAEDPCRAEALTAATIAALALVDMLKDAAITHVGFVRADAAPAEGPQRPRPMSRRPQRPEHQRPESQRSETQRSGLPAKPRLLMGEVAAPKLDPDSRREAFRQFMTSHRLRPTLWARQAGVATGELLGYLTGRARGLSSDTAEKLARAAKVRPEDMFR